jgi:hypothetical protein
MLPSSSWTRIVLVLGGGIWAGLLALQGADVEVTWFRTLGGVIGVVIVLLAAFDQFLWRWPGIRRLSGRRLIRGTWRGELTSSWRDSTTGEPSAPVEVYLVIRQTYSDVAAKLLTPESKSRSVACTLTSTDEIHCSLAAIYMNTPELLIQDRSRIHHGAMILDVCENPPERLEGAYWTDRETKGQLSFTERRSRLAGSFASAQTSHSA